MNRTYVGARGRLLNPLSRILLWSLYQIFCQISGNTVDAIFTANFAVATAMIGNKTEAYRILENAKQKGYNDYTAAKQIIDNQ